MIGQLGDVNMGEVYITRGTHARGLSVVGFNPLLNYSYDAGLLIDPLRAL